MSRRKRGTLSPAYFVPLSHAGRSRKVPYSGRLIAVPRKSGSGKQVLNEPVPKSRRGRQKLFHRPSEQH